MRTSAEALAQCERNGVSLPEDVKTIAEAEGLRASVLDRYIALTRGGKIGGAFLATLFTWFPAIRDRALADPAFLFKLGAEVWGDVGLSVASELKARNTNASVFSDEAEFFFADVLASAALNAATLTMLSPTVVFGVSPGGGRALRTANRVDGKLNDFLRLVFCRALPPRFPASAFQKGNFTTANRAATVVLQGVRVGGVSVLAGFAGKRANAACRAAASTSPGATRTGTPTASTSRRRRCWSRRRSGARTWPSAGTSGSSSSSASNPPSRRARSAPRRRALARGDGGASRREQRLGGRGVRREDAFNGGGGVRRGRSEEREKEKGQEVIYR